MKTIFHLDMDAFFVSVERILDPSLEGKPVIVGGDPNGRGIVAACSYETRKFGVQSGMPARTAYRLCPQALFVHGHGREYGLYSKLVRKFLEEYFPVVQPASIDEFCLDFSGCERMYGSTFAFAKKIQTEIFTRFHLPCSIGIATNKTLAKIASDFNKPMGVTLVPPGKEKEFLAPLPIEKIPGIGKKLFPLLRARGFRIVSDIANASPDYLTTILGKYGLDLWEKSNGKGNDIISTDRERKSISKETTFDTDLLNKTKIEEILFDLVAKASQLLRNENWQTSTVSIKLRYSDFATITRSRTINPTDDDKVIYNNAVYLFRKAYTRRVGVRLIGIHLSKLSNFGEQEVLFEDENIIRKRMLRAVMKIRDKYGYNAINIGKN